MKVVCQKVSNLNQMAIQLLLISTGATTYWASDRVLSHLKGKKYSVFFVISKISIFLFEKLFSLHLDPPPYCGLAQLIFLQSSLSSKSQCKISNLEVKKELEHDFMFGFKFWQPTSALNALSNFTWEKFGLFWLGSSLTLCFWAMCFSRLALNG